MKKLTIKADGKLVLGFYGSGKVLIAEAKDDKGNIPFKIFAVNGDALKGYEIFPYAITWGYGDDIQECHRKACKALAEWYVYKCGYGHYDDKKIDIALWLEKIKFDTKQSIKLIDNETNRDFVERLFYGGMK